MSRPPATDVKTSRRRPRDTGPVNLVHSSLGVIELSCLSLFSEDGRQRLLWFAPTPGTEAEDQLRLLSVIGSQDLGAVLSHPEGDRR
jgi:hypothetical protein